VNWHDIQSALDTMGVDIDEMIDWYNQSDEMPFPYALPHIPLPKKVVLIQPSTATDVKKKPKEGSNSTMSSLAIEKPYAPPFLPVFPDKRTYVDSPVYVERETDLRKIRKKKVDQNRKVEQALTRMQREASELSENGDEKEIKTDKNEETVIPRNYKNPVSLLAPIENRTPYWGRVVEEGSTSNSNKSRKRKKSQDLP